MTSPVGAGAAGRLYQHQVRARYVETDAQGVVHHSSYVPWLEEVRIEALREAGYSYRKLEAEGLKMPVTEVQVRYRRSAFFDDVISLQTKVSVSGRFQLCFETAIKRDDELLASAKVTVACVTADGKLTAVPEHILTALG